MMTIVRSLRYMGKYERLLRRKYSESGYKGAVLANPLIKAYVEDLLNEYRKDQRQFPLKMQRIDELMQSINNIEDNVKSLRDLCEGSEGDVSFQKSLNAELDAYRKALEEEESKLLDEITSEEYGRRGDIILEVSAGIGGQEAMLFAKELFDMYFNYVNFKSWVAEICDYNETETGGIRNGSILISGNDCLDVLGHEGGVHRVQRIPKTEKSGRIHTSTVTVAILPQPSEIDVVIDDKDLQFETKTARGPGGQHVNKVETAVRIHHIPTGLIVECQTHKSQYKNREIALRKLRSKLFEIESNKRQSDTKSLRKSQMGTRSRNEKIRTYNFNQDRVSDHRLKTTVHNLPDFLNGTATLDKFLEKLLRLQKEERTRLFLQSLKNA